LRFDLLFGVGDGVGDAFFRLAEAVGDGVGDTFFAEVFLCFRVGVGVGVAKIFLIFLPNDSSAASVRQTAPNIIAMIKSHFINSAARRKAIIAQLFNAGLHQLKNFKSH
jgi:hypothetical protein